MFEEFVSHGVTEDTPKNIMLGAGTIHKNFAYGYYSLTTEPNDWNTNYKNYYTKSGSTYSKVSGSTAPSFSSGTYYDQRWNFVESLIGATSGGSKVTITPEIKTVEVDGALVKVKGLDYKVGEVAKLETNLVEITPELLKSTIIGQTATSDVTGFDMITSKSDISSGDYFENFAFVGKKGDGMPIIIIFENALCTSGFETEAKNKDNAVVKCVFECYQDTTGDLTKLPYKIYYPTATSNSN